MSWTRNRKYLDLLTEFPPFEECEDYYDFCDHVASLCREHHVCMDNDRFFLDVGLYTRVNALLEFAKLRSEKEES